MNTIKEDLKAKEVIKEAEQRKRGNQSQHNPATMHFRVSDAHLIF